MPINSPLYVYRVRSFHRYWRFEVGGVCAIIVDAMYYRDPLKPPSGPPLFVAIGGLGWTALYALRHAADAILL